MSRPERIHHPGLIYHVFNRGNNQQAVFLEHEDYEKYLGLVYRFKKKYGFKLFAYCLMTNHVHLLIQVSDQGSISKIMQSITIAHTRHYHHKYNTGGHIWQGRFQSPIVSDDEYLLNAMLYIEQNPVKAKMVKGILDYPWTSYKLQMMKREPKLIDRLENPVYQNLGQTEQERREAYEKVMQQEFDGLEEERIERCLKGGGHFISEKFEKQIKEMLPRKLRRGRPRKN